MPSRPRYVPETPDLIFWTLLAAAWGVTSSLCLDAVPRPFGDEAWYAAPTLELRDSGVPRVPTVEGRGGIELYYLQPKLLLNLLALPAAALAGDSLSALRAVTAAAGFLGAVATYRLAAALYGKPAGRAAAALLLADSWVFVTARTFRPEIVVMTTVAWAAAGLVSAVPLPGTPAAGERDRVVWWGASGLAVSAALLSHQIAWLVLAVLPAAALLSGARPRPGRFLPGAAAAAAAALPLTGAYAAYVLYASATSGASWTAQMTGETAAAPATVAGLARKEAARWANFLHLPAGAAGAASYLLVPAVLAARRRPADTFLLFTVVLSAAAFFLFVPLPTGRYLTVLVPFVAAAAGEAVVSSAGPVLRAVGTSRAAGVIRGLGMFRKAAAAEIRSGPLRAAAAGSVLAAAAFSLAGSAFMWFSYRDAGLARFGAELKGLVRPGEKAAGPLLFSLLFRGRPYLEVHVPPDFEGAAKGWLTERIERHRPDVYIETTTNLMSTGGTGPRPVDFAANPQAAEAARILAARGRLRGEIASRDYGPVRVWELDY